MTRPRLLLVPTYTELQWGIRPQLEEWADVIAYDPPGVGGEPMPPGLTVSPGIPIEERGEVLGRWREAIIARGLGEVDRRGWTSFVVVMDGDGTPTGVRLAAARAGSVQGLAIGHAALSRSTEGERPALNKEVWEAMGALLRTDSEAFIRHGIAQMTQGSFDAESAGRMIERFPETELIVAVWEMLGSSPDQYGDEIAELGKPLLLAQHVGCIGSTEEGYRDAVAAFPDAHTVGCPEACEVSPAFAAAMREFCAPLEEIAPKP